MKFKFTSAKLNFSITTNSGKPVYSHDAENVTIQLDVPALIESAVVVGSILEQVVKNSSLNDIEALVASMQQQAETNEPETDGEITH